MDSSSQIKTGAILSYISIGINVLSGLIYTPWMIHSIGKEDYGLFTLALSVISLLVFDFGLSSVITYDSQLRGFQRVTLQPGETRRIHFTLLPEDLEMLDKDMHWIVEPGEFEVLIGSSSEDIRLKGKFEMMQP